jgi:hypothetical protein
MMFPLVRDLAAEGIPVRLTCGVLGFSPQAFYKWRARPCSDRDWHDAQLTNAIVDVHVDDPEFGYRFIADELEAAGHRVGERRVWRLCRRHRIWSTTTKKGRRHGKTPGPAVHDDLVQRQFNAPAPDVVWVTDITEHPTVEGKLYCCAIKDLFSNRIVGYALDERMTAKLAVSRCVPRSLDDSPTGRWWCIRTAARSSAPVRSGPCSSRPGSLAPWAGSLPPVTTQRWSRSSPCCRRTSSTDAGGVPAASSPTPPSSGSSTPTTADADSDPSASSPPSSSNSPSPPPTAPCTRPVPARRPGAGPVGRRARRNAR